MIGQSQNLSNNNSQANLGCDRWDCPIAVDGRGMFSCTTCGRSVAPEGDILGDSWCPSLVNALETIDYDASHGVNFEASRGIGALWWNLIRAATPAGVPARVLEIGAGTGLLTLGMAMQD